MVFFADSGVAAVLAQSPIKNRLPRCAPLRLAPNKNPHQENV